MGFLKGYLYEIKSGIKIPFIVAIATGSGPKTFKTKLYAALAELWAGFESKRGPAECDKAILTYNPVFGANFATDIFSQPLFVELLCFVCKKIHFHHISNVLGLWGFLEEALHCKNHPRFVFKALFEARGDRPNRVSKGAGGPLGHEARGMG